MRFELAWAYPPNHAAGEDIRVAAGTPRWPASVPRREFWLVDDQRYDALYASDGTWLGVRATPTGPAETWQAAAVHASVSLYDYLARHPDVLERVAVAR